ncbi:MAG TPA: hypothetical protein PLP34_08795 [Chitinophagaceae bacterium]|nr:hypothetical protein [Chitinophagaceae bacterium]
MKNKIIALRWILVLLGVGLIACQKTQPVTNNLPSTGTETVSCIYQGKEYRTIQELKSFMQNESVLLAIPDQEHEVAYYLFDDASAAETFCNSQSNLQHVAAHIQDDQVLRTEALRLHESDYYQEHGAYSAAFQSVLDKHSSHLRAIQGTLYQNPWYAGAAWNKFTGTPAPVLPAFIDNNAKSAKLWPMQPVYTLFDLPFFGGFSFVVAANIPYLGVMDFANRTSSVN